MAFTRAKSPPAISEITSSFPPDYLQIASKAIESLPVAPHPHKNNLFPLFKVVYMSKNISYNSGIFEIKTSNVWMSNSFIMNRKGH